MRERPIPFKGEMVRAVLDGRKTQTRRTRGLPQDVEPHDDWQLHRFIDGIAYFGNKRSLIGPASALANANNEEREIRCPYGQPGDRLWVRETLRVAVACSTGIPLSRLNHRLRYHASYKPVQIADSDEKREWLLERIESHFKRDFVTHEFNIPSIHMPRWASRILLEVTDVRVERVKYMSEEDAIAEGAREFPDIAPGPMFGKTDCRWSMEQPQNSEQCLSSPLWAFANYWERLNVARGFGWDENPWVWVVSFRRIDQ